MHGKILLTRFNFEYMSIDRVDVELIVLKVVVVVMTAQNDVESLHFESVN